MFTWALGWALVHPSYAGRHINATREVKNRMLFDTVPEIVDNHRAEVQPINLSPKNASK